MLVLILDAKGSTNQGRANWAGSQRLWTETALQPASHRHSLSAVIPLASSSPSAPERSPGKVQDPSSRPGKRIYWKDTRLLVKLKGELKNRKSYTRSYSTAFSWAPLLERVNTTCFFCSCVVLLKSQSPGGENLMDYVSILWMY